MQAAYGQTAGKVACKVIVLDVSERPISVRPAVLRDIFDVILLPINLVIYIYRVLHGVDPHASAPMNVVDTFLTYSTANWFLVEIITMLTNDKRRALHDFIAGTVVIRKSVAVTEPAAAAAGR